MIEAGDQITQIIYIKTSPKMVVYLQALFEIYESVAIVKTIDVEKSILALITTIDYKELCLNILESVKEYVKFELILEE